MSSTDRRNILKSVMTGAAALAGTQFAAAQITTASAASSPAGEPASHLTFNTGNTALVLIDHQVGTINWAGELANEDERNQLKMWTRVIARFARSAAMPVVLTSSLETEAQGPLLPEFKDILPDEYEARIKRTGVINAWDDAAFAEAVRKTGRKKLLMGGLTTDVCLVPPAISAHAEGFDVVALVDISAATTRLAAQNSRDLMQGAGIELMTVTPMLTSMLGNYKNPASAGFFEAFGKEGVFEAFGRGNLR
jgi:nicotinamidase-related amidase